MPWSLARQFLLLRILSLSLSLSVCVCVLTGYLSHILEASQKDNEDRRKEGKDREKNGQVQEKGSSWCPEKESGGERKGKRNKDTILAIYRIQDFSDEMEFLRLIAKKMGKYKKKGILGILEKKRGARNGWRKKDH